MATSQVRDGGGRQGALGPPPEIADAMTPHFGLLLFPKGHFWSFAYASGHFWYFVFPFQACTIVGERIKQAEQGKKESEGLEVNGGAAILFLGIEGLPIARRVDVFVLLVPVIQLRERTRGRREAGSGD